jgi:hypothetical protein
MILNAKARRMSVVGKSIRQNAGTYQAYPKTLFMMTLQASVKFQPKMRQVAHVQRNVMYWT